MLRLSRKRGESLVIGWGKEEVRMTVTSVSSQKVRLVETQGSGLDETLSEVVLEVGQKRTLSVQGHDVELLLVGIDGPVVRLGIEASREVEIDRGEIRELKELSMRGYHAAARPVVHP